MFNYDLAPPGIRACSGTRHTQSSRNTTLIARGAASHAPARRQVPGAGAAQANRWRAAIWPAARSVLPKTDSESSPTRTSNPPETNDSINLRPRRRHHCFQVPHDENAGFLLEAIGQAMAICRISPDCPRLAQHPTEGVAELIQRNTEIACRRQNSWEKSRQKKARQPNQTSCCG